MTVAVVGLGAAGVRTAMLLERAGVDVSLFEARDRPGGRMVTAVTESGAEYEAGGEWVDADHRRCHELLAEFALKPRATPDGPRKLMYRGRECTDVTLWNDAREDDLRVEAAAREICDVVRGAKPARPNSHDHRLREWDNRTLDNFLREHTSSARGLWWVSAKYRSDEGDDPERVGLLGWITGYLNYVDREGDEMSAFRFPGGATRLFARMLATLRAEPHYEAVVKRVRQDAVGVTLEFENGSARVDRAVITLPPRLLERVAFEPALAGSKRCAIEGCGASRTVKLVWEFDRRWWDDLDWGGSMLCDGPLQQTWDACPPDVGSSREGPGLLCAYIGGEQAAAWTVDCDPVQNGLAELTRLFPAAEHCFRSGRLHDWIADPFSRGAFSHLPPRYVVDHLPHLAPPAGRIHFAGEYTSPWNGFIEGALESAERVTAEIVAAG